MTLVAGKPSTALVEGLGGKTIPEEAVEFVLGSPDFQRR
jgi:hypothetical protein